MPFRVGFNFSLHLIYLGAVLSLDLVWSLSDLLNALMALPNLICLWLLRKEVIDQTRSAGLMGRR